MKKRFTKMMSVVLSLLMLCTVFPLTVGAEFYDGLTYSVSNGEVSIIDTYDSITEAEIPSTIDGYPVTSIGDDAFEYCKNLASITIPDSVTSIGRGAFSNCRSLTDITIPDSVTSIGDHAFLQCTSITSITIPDKVTSIGEGTFYDCVSLTNITIPDSVTSIGEAAFYYCISLTNITIPDSVTSINGYAFRWCDSLTSIRIPASVTSIGDCAFSGCTNLTSITVDEKNENFSSDEYGALFNKEKTELILYPIGNIETEYTIPASVTSIGYYALNGCTNLKSIRILNPDCEIYNDNHTIDENTTIYGYEGSKAQAYAEKYGREFVSLDEKDCEHNYVEKITTPATHFTEGLRTFTCECGDSYTEVIEIIPHDYATETIYPTCSTEGYTIYTCECGDTYNDDYVGYDYSVHVNEDGDGLCDYCGELATDCSCNCHSTNGFIAFFWKILNFLQRLFGTNPVCSCGMAHY